MPFLRQKREAIKRTQQFICKENKKCVDFLERARQIASPLSSCQQTIRVKLCEIFMICIFQFLINDIGRLGKGNSGCPQQKSNL